MWICLGRGGGSFFKRLRLLLFFGITCAFSIIQPLLTVTQTWLLWLCFLFFLRPVEVYFSVQCLSFRGIFFVRSAPKCKTSSSPPLNPAEYLCIFIFFYYFAFILATIWEYKAIILALLTTLILIWPMFIGLSYFSYPISYNNHEWHYDYFFKHQGGRPCCKKQKIISLLKRENAQIALLQETHLTDFEHIKERLDRLGVLFIFQFT